MPLGRSRFSKIFFTSSFRRARRARPRGVPSGNADTRVWTKTSRLRWRRWALRETQLPPGASFLNWIGMHPYGESSTQSWSSTGRRHHGAHDQLLHLAAENPERDPRHLPRLGPWRDLSIPGAICLSRAPVPRGRATWLLTRSEGVSPWQLAQMHIY